MTALYEILLTREADYGSPDMDLGTVSLRWHETDSERTTEISRPITTDDLSDRYRSTDPRFQMSVMVAEYAEILRGDGRAYFSDTTLNELADDIWQLEDLADDPDVREFIDLVEHAASLRSR